LGTREISEFDRVCKRFAREQSSYRKIFCGLPLSGTGFLTEAYRAALALAQLSRVS
jgi:hypothetical protein